MRVNISLSGHVYDKNYIIHKYLCPFCPTFSGSTEELTVAIDRTTLKTAWTECTRGYANCCSIAELHAKIHPID